MKIHKKIIELVCEINGVAIAVIDTGASHNYIKQEITRELMLPTSTLKPPEKLNVQCEILKVDKLTTCNSQVCKNKNIE